MVSPRARANEWDAPCCDRAATEHTTSTRSGCEYVEKCLENKPHFRTHTHYRLVFPQNTPCPTTTRLRSSSATQIPPTLQRARHTVFSRGTPSNFHLNFIPGSLDEIHFSLGKPRNCVEFTRFKKERKKKGVETRESEWAREKERVKRKKKKVLPRTSLILRFCGVPRNFLLPIEAVAYGKEDGNSYFNIVPVKCTE